MSAKEVFEVFNVDDIIEYASDSSGYIEEVTENETEESPEIRSSNKIANILSLYQCQQCSFLHSSLKMLTRHYKKYHTNEPISDDSENEHVQEILVCSVCYAQYLTLSLLKKHMIDDHGFHPIEAHKNNAEATISKPEYDLKCGDNEEENEEDDYIRREKEEWLTPVPFRELKRRLLKDFTYKCSVKGCFYKFNTREKQESHFKCHTSNKIEKVREFKCMECGIELKTWRVCTSHMWKEHKIDLDLLKCPFCLYKAVTSVKIWHHLRVHQIWRSKVLKKRPQSKGKRENTGNRWYSQKTCQICGRLFANSKTLSKHVKTVHNKIKPFICNVCGRKSARKTTWIVHMRQHTGEKPLHCKTCSFKASDPSVLKTHEMRHNNAQQYKCSLCEYSAIQSSSFKTHVKIYHPEEFKKLSCDQCTYVSVSPEALDAHKKDHKKGLLTIEDSCEATETTVSKTLVKIRHPEKLVGNVEISSDCFLPLESTDSIAHDPTLDTGGVTIPAHSEDTQFPNFMNS